MYIGVGGLGSNIVGCLIVGVCCCVVGYLIVGVGFEVSGIDPEW